MSTTAKTILTLVILAVVAGIYFWNDIRLVQKDPNCFWSWSDFSGICAYPDPAPPGLNTTVPNSVSNTLATSTVDTTGWKTYTNSEYGFEVKYPPSYKIIDENVASGTIGFRDMRWDSGDVIIDGATVKLHVYKNITMDKVLDFSGFVDITKAKTNGVVEVPPENIGDKKYFFRGSLANPPIPADEFKINGYPAIVAEVSTRLYQKDGGYIAAGLGEQALIISDKTYAVFHSQDGGADILSTFKFTK